MLIVWGATHNFISINLVQELDLPRVGTKGYEVLMGTDMIVKREGICKGVVISLQNIIEDFVPLDLGSSDVILGMRWLETLGVTKVNWKELAMKFKIDGGRGEAITLKGDPSLSRYLVSLKSLVKAIREQRGLF